MQQFESTLVTGATGFLGTAVVPRLLKTKPGKVYAIVRASSPEKLEARKKRYLRRCPEKDRVVFPKWRFDTASSGAV